MVKVPESRLQGTVVLNIYVPAPYTKMDKIPTAGLPSLRMGIFASTVMVLAALRKQTPGSLGHFWSG